MALELTISLKYVDEPKWRTLLVSEQSTFEEFHLYIQTAFAWSNSHLHLFLKDGVQIGPKIEAFLDDSDALDEKEITLADFLKEPGDRMNYVYDLGDDWQHEIVLERTADLPIELPLPFCLTAEGNKPLEQEFIDEQLTEEFLTNDELVLHINERLIQFQDDSFLTVEEEEEDSPNEMEWNQLFDLADEFKAMKPWTNLHDFQLIAVWCREIADYVYCSIMGNAGETYGLSCFPGQAGLLSFSQILDANEFLDESDILFSQRSISVFFNNRNDLDEEEYDLIKSLERKYRGKHQWPSFVSMVPDKLPWRIDQKECLILTEILLKLNAFLSGTGNTAEKVPGFGEEIFAITDEEEPVLLSTDALIEKAVQSPGLELDLSEIEWKRMKKKQSSNRQEIELAFIQMEEPVQRTPQSRPFLPYIVVLIEKGTGMVLHYDLVETVNNAEAVQEKVYQFFNDMQELPQAVYMFDDFFAANAEAFFTKLNISLIKVEQLDGVDQFVKMMSEDGLF